ncbi:glycylpeptide N-tetradecanoyltransferase [Blastocladiella emersonii ATCC 22665]|nr:glycylpeptide N-tetradecanoyltransferase [Blastocladiella emersonii ATCC 22665]
MPPKKKHPAPSHANGGGDGSGVDDAATQLAFLRLLMEQAAANGGGGGLPAPPKEHKFWKTQPVIQSPAAQRRVAEDGPLHPSVPRDEVRQEPYHLPAGFKWDVIDVLDAAQLDEVHGLLLDNYVEDTDATFRFGYPRDMLQWALMPPGWKQAWHLGVRVEASNRLVAFISGVPATIVVNDNPIDMVEINFLCVLKKLRSKRMAPVLIKEITRRCHLEGIFQAIYTAGAELPGAVASPRYWHRSLNPQKLLDTGFSHPPRDKSLADYVKHLEVLPEWRSPKLRPMTRDDVPHVAAGLEKYLAHFNLRPRLSEDEVAHWLLPRDGVISSYVIENDAGDIESFFSYYSIPSKVLGHPKHSQLTVAYTMYYFYPVDPTDPAGNQSRLVDLFRNALVLAKNADHDVFNCLGLMENQGILQDIKFAKGDGVLHYYIYNWKCKPFDSTQVAMVLV